MLRSIGPDYSLDGRPPRPCRQRCCLFGRRRGRETVLCGNIRDHSRPGKSNSPSPRQSRNLYMNTLLEALCIKARPLPQLLVALWCRHGGHVVVCAFWVLDLLLLAGVVRPAMSRVRTLACHSALRHCLAMWPVSRHLIFLRLGFLLCKKLGSHNTSAGCSSLSAQRVWSL